MHFFMLPDQTTVSFPAPPVQGVKNCTPNTVGLSFGRDNFTLRGLQAELAERGVNVDYRTVWNFVHAEGLNFKKKRVASKGVPTSPATGRGGRRIRDGSTPSASSSSTRPGQKPTWLRSGAGLCADGGFWRAFRMGTGNPMTFLAALRCDRIDAPCVFDGPINGLSFTIYVEQFLIPTLRPGDVVILDNLGSHKGKAGEGQPRVSTIRWTPARSSVLIRSQTRPAA